MKNETPEIKFSLVDYFNYLEAKGNSRCVYEGEDVLEAGHIILCGITDWSENKISVYALCLQTSALQASPHVIQGSFLTNGNNAIVNGFECSCKAGQSGRCKHISAVLIKCTRSLSQLEIISQTDVKCVWSAQKSTTKELYKPIPIKNMPCFKDLVCTSDELNGTVKSLIEKNAIELLPNSAFSMHSVGRRAVVKKNIQEHLHVFEMQNINIVFNNARQSPIMMELSVINGNFSKKCCEDLIQSFKISNHEKLALVTKNSIKDWQETRQYRITGSRIYEIYTYCGANWQNKAIKYFWPKMFSNKYTKHGLEHKHNARAGFKECTGLNIFKTGIILSPHNEWLGYSPDGIIMSNNKPITLLEIKCPFAGKSKNLDEVLKTLNYLKLEEEIYTLREKHKYFGQIQLGMAILNVEMCYFVIYRSNNKNMAIIKVPFDYEFSKKMLLKVKYNFIQHIAMINLNN